MEKTILVVDDIAFVRKTLTQILTKAGYRVVAEASDGREAIELYAKHRPHVVMMDVVMPGVSGIEATRKIIKADKEAKVIVVSAMGQEALVMDAINAGAKDYLLKPFTASLVVMTLERLIGRGQDRGVSAV